MRQEFRSRVDTWLVVVIANATLLTLYTAWREFDASQPAEMLASSLGLLAMLVVALRHSPGQAR